MIRRSEYGVLAVDDPDDNVSYTIEPARFDLGLSRVEMVDYHLSDLASRIGPTWTAHIDELLDARAEFQSDAAS